MVGTLSKIIWNYFEDIGFFSYRRHRRVLEGGKIWENGIETCKISCMK